MNAFLGRISKSYSDLSGMFLEWSTQSDFIWVYEHEADDKVSRTHCHILIINSKRNSEDLKKLVSWKKMEIPKGNTGSSFKMYKKIYDFGHEGEWYKALTYYSKGNLLPKFANGANADAIADRSRREWENVIKKTANANANANANDVVVVSKRSKLSLFQVSEMAYTMYVEQVGQEGIFIDDSRRAFDGRRMCKIVIGLLKANHILAHKFTVRNIIQDIRANLTPDKYIDEILSMV